MLSASHSLASLVGLALAYRIVVLVALVALASPMVLNLPLFDTSPELLVPKSSPVQVLLRWDTLWFVKIAGQGGYKHQQETAFAWGWMWTMRTMGMLVGWAREAMGVGPIGGVVTIPQASGPPWVGEDIGDILIGGAAASWIAGIAATVVLHRLTLRLTRSPSFAHLTSLVYILSPSPGALVSPYTEPLYAFLTFSGMLATTSSSHLVATGLFALATSVRPLGVLNAGYVIWGLLVEPLVQGRARTVRAILPRLLLAMVLTIVIASPFIKSQHTFYKQFCFNLPRRSLPRPSWCESRVPLLYPYVQKKYWNVGFLNYFHPAQLPNFLVSAPIYALLLYTHLNLLPPALGALLPFISLPRPRRRPTQAERLLSRPEMVPYLIHSIILSGILFWASHVQIVLRLAQTMPVVWWGAAALVSRREGESDEPQTVQTTDSTGGELEGTSVHGSGDQHGASLRRRGGADALTAGGRAHVAELGGTKGPRMHTYGRWYLGWVVAWGAIATILWAGFYPPA